MAEIANLPTMYIDGCNLSNSETIITISKGQVRDSTNQFDIVIPNPLSLVSTTNGLNGLDTGSLTGTVFYNVFIIGDSSNFKPAASILSRSTTPVLPFGYDLIRLIGVWLTQGSAPYHLQTIYQIGSSNDRYFFYDTPIHTSVFGASNTTFTPITLENCVPNSSSLAIFNSSYIPTAVNDTFSLRPTGSNSNATILQNGIVAGVEQDSQFQMPILLASGVPSIDYKVSNGSDTLTLFLAAFNLSL